MPIHKEKLLSLLHKHFQYESFRKGQAEIIMDILAGKDVLGILPTGSGKSLCYQLPAIVLPGLTVVVSPLISLMLDQVKRLKAIHYKKVAALNSFVHAHIRRKILHHLKDYNLLYISPEMLQQEEVIAHLKQVPISLFVVDEAHCISQWGHEFRPDYLRLHKTIEALNQPPVLALSATATTEVQDDIIHSLKRKSMVKHIYPMDRENIILHVQEVRNDHEKFQIIKKLITKYNFPILIYFSSRKEAEKVTVELAKQIPTQQLAYYHGGLSSDERIMIQQQFMNDQLDVICCTSAFGMGIDKKDIRLIIHYHFPPQLESYIQEFGRAGRDGCSSVSLVLYTAKDQYLPETIIEHEFVSKEQLRQIFQKLLELYRQKLPLPRTENEIEQTFGIKETQWRSLKYQFEQQQVIQRGFIVYHPKRWQEAFTKMEQHRLERLSLKRDKLLEMTQWLQTDKCLRKQLYIKFQTSYEKPKEHCCTNCGFTFDQWHPKEQEKRADFSIAWKEKLQNLLLGDSL